MGFARPLTLFACVSVLALAATSAFAQTTLTLEEALARARRAAPEIVAAQLAVDEARARLAHAGIRQTNPEIDFGIGRRAGELERSADVEVSATHMFEPAGRRRARTDAASAGVDRSTAQLDEVVRLTLRDTALAFLQVAHGDQRLALLATAETLANSVLQSADRRYRAGDIAVLDVNLARAAHARVRADRQAAEAERIAALSTLRILTAFEGDLRVAEPWSLTEIDSTRAIASALERPAIRELESAIRGAEADVRLAQTFSRPDFGLGASFKREEGDRIIGGSFTISLPLFFRGQEQRAVSNARASRLRAELEASKSRIRAEVESAMAAYDRRREAVTILEREALPGLDENEQLAARSFEVGQIGLPDLLLIRREMLETRFQYLLARLEAALARVEVDAATGVWR